MIGFVKSKVLQNKKLYENFLSLYLLQGTNYLLPLITFPYLSRVLGPEKFGLISFANAFVAYFTTLTDYGFNLSGTRQIALHKDDKQKIEEIFSSIVTIKVISLLLSAVIFFVVILFIPKFSADLFLYGTTFGLVIGSVLFPTWFFQGIEEMKFITFLNFILKLSFSIGVFLFVKEEKDYLKVQIINSVGSIIVGALALGLILFHYKIKFRRINFKTLLFHLAEGWYIFITSILTTLYNQSNIFILGIFTNNTIVGYFAIADKIRSLLLASITPLTQALFPYLSTLYKKNKAEFLSKHTLILKVFCILSLLLFTLAYFFKETIVLLISGKEFLAAVPIFEILIFSVFINGIGYVFTTLFLIVKGSNKLVFRFFFGSLITYSIITLALFWFNSINEYNLSIGLVFSESVVVVCAMFNYFKWRSTLVRTLLIPES